MLDIKDINGNHVDYVTGDSVLDMKTFQEKNPQDEIIKKIDKLWIKDYISFDQATSHYKDATNRVKTGIPYPYKGFDKNNTPILSPTTYEDYPKYANWLAITLYDNDNSTPESYEKYEHLYTDEWFGSIMNGLNELFAVDNLMEYIDIFQLFLTPAGYAYYDRDWYDLQCEHESVQLNEDKTPHEIDTNHAESSRWKHWTPHRYRKYLLSEHTGIDFQPFGYHHDPYNLIWLKLSNTKRLMTRNIERKDVPVRANSVIGFDGWMHSPDPTSWGISMRLTLLDSFWTINNHTSEICKKLIEHARSYRYTPIYPDQHYDRFTNLDFLDYSIKDDNKEFLDNEEYHVKNWQFYRWWDSEEGKLLLDTMKEWLKKN
jgi:hypothetical protein